MSVYYSAVCHERKERFYSGDMDDFAFCRAVVVACYLREGKWEIIGDYDDTDDGYADIAPILREFLADFPLAPRGLP